MRNLRLVDCFMHQIHTRRNLCSKLYLQLQVVMYFLQDDAYGLIAHCSLFAHQHLWFIIQHSVAVWDTVEPCENSANSCVIVNVIVGTPTFAAVSGRPVRLLATPYHGTGRLRWDYTRQCLQRSSLISTSPFRGGSADSVLRSIPSQIHRKPCNGTAILFHLLSG